MCISMPGIEIGIATDRSPNHLEPLYPNDTTEAALSAQCTVLHAHIDMESTAVDAIQTKT